MSFTRLTIAKKLGFFVVTMILLIVMTTAVSFYSFDKISRSYLDVEAKAVPNIMAIFRIRMASDRLLSEIQGFVASGDRDEITEFETTLTELEQLHDEYEATRGDSEEKEIRQKIWAQKEQIAGIAYHIFSKFEQRAGLLEELKNIETFYVGNHDKFTGERREGLDEIVLAAKSLHGKSLEFVARNLLMADEQEAGGGANMGEEVEQLELTLKEYLNNSTSRGIYRKNFTNSVRQLLEIRPAIIEVTGHIWEHVAEVEEFEDDILATLEQALALRWDKLHGLTTNVTHTIQRAKFFTVSLLLLFVTLSSAIGFRVSKLIVSSISKLAHSTQQISEGDFSHRTEKLSNDELGILADSFNEMVDKLEHTTTTIDNLNREIAEREKAETEKDKLETQLRQAHKMEAIGTLAGGIAHGFNNILGSMIGYADLALQDIPEGSVPNDNLKQVLIAGLRAKELVRQILTFSRSDEQQQKPEQISSIVNEALKLLRSSLPSTIEIRQNIEAASSVIMADSTQIHQLVINLCANAASAMEGTGGVLEVSLTDVDLESEATYGSERLSCGQYVELSIKDTGRGMDSETMERIFDPFFTTKGVGEGTGMGLAAVHGIVKKHGGAIAVASEPGKGTTFSMRFPKIGDHILPQESSQGTIGGRGEIILVVDDEEPLADMTKQMLEQAGYKVVEARNGGEGVKLFRTQPTDLVITDIIMPEQEGIETIRELSRDFPDIKIVAISGGGRVDSKNYLELAGQFGVTRTFGKPLDWEEFLAALEELLAEAPVR